jgi:hypothetical protein
MSGSQASGALESGWLALASTPPYNMPPPSSVRSSLRPSSASASRPQANKPRRGIICAAIIWFGFIVTSWAKAYIFEVRTFQIYAICTGYYLIELILIGAIVGAWKKKPAIALS